MKLAAEQRFTVIIVNYNGAAMLLDCVRALRASQMAAERIVIVDNGSRDDSLAGLTAEFPACRIVRMGCNAGFARAVNHGLAEVHTEFALLLNNDATIAPAACAAFASAFDARPRAALLGGRLRYADGRLQNAVAAFPRLSAEFLPRPLLRRLWPARYLSRPEGSAPLPVESVIGALLAVRMSAVRAFGPLDEDFFFFLEETEWCHRARKHGWEVWHIPAAEAVHAQGGTARQHSAMARVEYHRSHLLYYRKTAPALYPLCLFMACVKVTANALGNALLAALTLGLVQGIRARAAVDLRILGWYMLGRPAGVGLPDKCPRSAARR
jgi:GT2 family glycosyltransferase